MISLRYPHTSLPPHLQSLFTHSSSLVTPTQSNLFIITSMLSGLRSVFLLSTHLCIFWFTYYVHCLFTPITTIKARWGQDLYLFCSVMYPQCSEQDLILSGCWINICWMNELLFPQVTGLWMVEMKPEPLSPDSQTNSSRVTWLHLWRRGWLLLLREEGTRSTYFMSGGKQGSEGIHGNKGWPKGAGTVLKRMIGEELSDAMTLNRDLSGKNEGVSHTGKRRKNIPGRQDKKCKALRQVYAWGPRRWPGWLKDEQLHLMCWL